MKNSKKTIVKSEQSLSTGVETTLNNVWVEPMFNITNPKIINHPKFKELTAGAKAFAALILQTTPPGNEQKIALESVSESYQRAVSGFVRGAASAI